MNNQDKEKKLPEAFGSLKGSITIKGDIVAPIDEIWDATLDESIKDCF